MSERINVLLVEPGKAPRPTEAENTMDSFQTVLGGPVEVGCFLPQRVFLICREGGLAEGLRPNRVNPANGECIAGPFLLCGIPEGGDGFASLPLEREEQFIGLFARPAEFMLVGDKALSDPDDVADMAYQLWDSLKDGQSVVLKKCGGPAGDEDA